MSQTNTLLRELSPQSVDFIRLKVSSGEFATEAEVIEESLALMQDSEVSLASPHRDEEVEKWLHEVVGPIYDRMKADPSRAIPAEQVLQHLEARRQRRKQG